MGGNRKSAISIAMSIIKDDISSRKTMSGPGKKDVRASNWLELLTAPLLLLPFFLIGLVASILGEFAFDSFLLKMIGRGLIVAVLGLVVVNNIVEICRNRQDPE